MIFNHIAPDLAADFSYKLTACLKSRIKFQPLLKYDLGSHYLRFNQFRQEKFYNIDRRWPHSRPPKLQGRTWKRPEAHPRTSIPSRNILMRADQLHRVSVFLNSAWRARIAGHHGQAKIRDSCSVWGDGDPGVPGNRKSYPGPALDARKG